MAKNQFAKDGADLVHNGAVGTQIETPKRAKRSADPRTAPGRVVLPRAGGAAGQRPHRLVGAAAPKFANSEPGQRSVRLT
jgi:hypothetical protein